MDSPKTRNRPITIAALALLALAGGCSTPVSIRSPGSKVGGSGSTSELIFTAAPVQEADEYWYVAADASRLDGRMHARDAETAFTQTAWPVAEAPRFDRPRRVWLWTNSPEQVIHFRRDMPRRRD